MGIREELDGLSPEEQTEWLKAHMPDWDGFLDQIRISREELAAHEASGAPGYPPGWITLDEYMEQRGLSNRARRSSPAPAQPSDRRDA
jgi:hypothetical protein